MIQKIAIFYNKHAGNSNKEIWFSEVKEILFRSELEFIPLNYESLKSDIEKIQKDNIDVAIVIGGDGSVNLMIQEIAGKDIALLVIPAGTANDLAVELGIVKRISEAVSGIRHKRTKNIDLISANGRYYATNGGFGMGGNLTNRINTLRNKVPFFKGVMKLFKHRIYTLFLLLESLDYKRRPNRVKITSEEYNDTIESYFTLINNQKKVAGKIQITEHSSNEDGVFTVVIFKHKSKAALVKCFTKIILGNVPQDDSDLVIFETAKIKIESTDSNKLSYFGDGEHFGEFDNVDIEVLPKVLKVYANDFEGEIFHEEE